MRRLATLKLLVTLALLWAVAPTPFLPGPPGSVVGEPLATVAERVDTTVVRTVVDAVTHQPHAIPS